MDRVKRNSLEIYKTILTVASKGAKKSRIVYRANLNFKIVKGYIEELQKNDLIVQEGRVFQTTPKGVDFINHYRGLEAFGLS